MAKKKKNALSNLYSHVPIEHRKGIWRNFTPEQLDEIKPVVKAFMAGELNFRCKSDFARHLSEALLEDYQISLDPKYLSTQFERIDNV